MSIPPVMLPALHPRPGRIRRTSGKWSWLLLLQIPLRIFGRPLQRNECLRAPAGVGMPLFRQRFETISHFGYGRRNALKPELPKALRDGHRRREVSHALNPALDAVDSPAGQAGQILERENELSERVAAVPDILAVCPRLFHGMLEAIEFVVKSEFDPATVPAPVVIEPFGAESLHDLRELYLVMIRIGVFLPCQAIASLRNITELLHVLHIKELVSMAIFIVLFIILSIVNIINPAFGWYLRYGWMVKGDSQPSEAYIFMSRVGGILALVVLLFVLFSGAIPF